MPNTIRLGTRGSQLALAQSHQIASQLRTLGHNVDLIVLKTTGDVTTGSLKEFGGEGVFTKRLQTALLNGEIDLAVHSLKDLPTDDIPGLKLGAIPRREDPRDAVVLCSNLRPKIHSLSNLPQAARIGTGSIRRKAQLLNLRPDLIVEDIRGNVDTRLEKLESENFDAIILASAGLNRLSLADRISFLCEPEQMAPAVGQGALGLEIRSDDDSTASALSELNNDESYAESTAERKMLNELRAGCMAPVGAISTVKEHELTLTGVVLSVDGRTKISATVSDHLKNAASVGCAVAQKLIDNGGRPLIG